MTTREVLTQVVDQLPEQRLQQLLDYARFLTMQEEADALQNFGRRQFARAYADDEPEYDDADLRGEDQR